MSKNESNHKITRLQVFHELENLISERKRLNEIDAKMKQFGGNLETMPIFLYWPYDDSKQLSHIPAKIAVKTIEVVKELLDKEICMNKEMLKMSEDLLPWE